MKKITFTNIPTWALYALEYGINEDPSLTKEDENLINEFVERNFPNGYCMDIKWNTEGFSYFPDFGLGSDTVEVDFYVD